MASNQNFRSAFNGFNRDDVVNYISYMTTKHENQLNQLHGELDALREELAQRPESVISPEEVEALKKQVLELQQALAEKDARLAQLQAQPAAPAAPAVNVAEMELDAYRRAESAERRAMERVDQMYARANGVVADTAARMEENAQLVSDMADRVLGNLEALQNAVAEGKSILADSARLMATVHPEK